MPHQKYIFLYFFLQSEAKFTDQKKVCAYCSLLCSMKKHSVYGLPWKRFDPHQSLAINYIFFRYIGGTTPIRRHIFFFFFQRKAMCFFFIAHLVHRSFAPSISESDPGRTFDFGGWVSQQQFMHTVRLKLETSLKRHQVA